MINQLKRIVQRLRRKKSAPVPETSEARRERLDPLDHRQRSRSWVEEDKPTGPRLLTASNFPFAETSTGTSLVLRDGRAMDSSLMAGMAMDGQTFVMDDCNGGAPCGSIGVDTNMNAYTVPPALMNWYASQSFIGYQACALLAQHWLIDKACSMSGEDAIRNGWELKARGDGVSISDKQLALIKEMDEKFNLTEEMIELNRFKNVFGIRVLIFNIKSDDPKYYEKPFNIDGVTEGSYRGISQVDPYWMMPMMTAESTADPSSEFFYDPEYWIISGKRYHRSHLIIVRGPEPADLLKPTYIFGGIPLTQRIYERVYAAERTANEAPLLATNKRTTAIHVDMEKAIANQASFEERLMMWIRYRDNHAVKVLGEDESMEQFDTSLADFDNVIMNQYQIVAAIAKTPSTKLLGTSPKGFNATGEHETISYHEELESIQKHVMSPFLTRHYMLLMRSLGLDLEVQHVWEPVDSVTMSQRAELNDKKAQTGKALIDGGVISPDEERNRIRDDKNSGYNRLQDDDAETTPGMSPEALAKFEKVDADKEKAQAAQTTAGANAAEAGAKPGAIPGQQAPGASGGQEAALPYGRGPNRTQNQAEVGADVDKALLREVVRELLAEVEPHIGINIDQFDQHSGNRSTSPSVKSSVRGSVDGPASVLGEMPAHKLPKVKMHGMTMTIENPRGTIRTGMDISGGNWSQKMPHHYGFIRGTKGADGDEMDCFIGPNADSQRVFVINQNTDGAFDEHKCMFGFNSAAEAKDAYHGSFSEDWKGFDSIVPMSMDQFKTWLKDGDCYSPLSAACIAQTQSAPQTA